MRHPRFTGAAGVRPHIAQYHTRLWYETFVLSKLGSVRHSIEAQHQLIISLNLCHRLLKHQFKKSGATSQYSYNFRGS